MKIKLSENLIKLIEHVYNKTGKYIYVVGGFVRNSLMNINTGDVDLCGEILASDLMKLLDEIDYTAHSINKTLGTILIHAKHERFEYTTFRVESYAGTGEHKPNKVVFTNSLEKDAKRRDFTVNAIYYNYIKDEIIDPFSGQLDIKAKIIKTVDNPNKTFKDDALRILRFIRFVNELNFKWDTKTYKSAKEQSHLLKNLSKERILAEVKLIINADTKYENKTQQVKVIKMFNKFNIYKYLFNSSFNNLKISKKTKTYKAFISSDYKTRYIAFVVLCLQAKLKSKTNSANVIFMLNTMLGAGGLKESKKNIQFIVKTYNFVQVLLYENLLNNNLLLNSQTINFYEFPEHLQSYFKAINNRLVTSLKNNKEYMKHNNIPFSVNELNITVKDLQKLGVANSQLSAVFNLLFNKCLSESLENSLSDLTEYVKSEVFKQ